MERAETALLEGAVDLLPVLLDALRMLPPDGAAPLLPGAALSLVSAAERALTAGTIPAETWHLYLDRTRCREFLLALPDAEARTRWVETAFGAIRASGYSLATLLSQRVAAHPDRVFLQASPRPESPCWTYAQTERRLRGIAAALASGPPALRRTGPLAERDAALQGAVVDARSLRSPFGTGAQPHVSNRAAVLLRADSPARASGRRGETRGERGSAGPRFFGSDTSSQPGCLRRVPGVHGLDAVGRGGGAAAARE